MIQRITQQVGWLWNRLAKTNEHKLASREIQHYAEQLEALREIGLELAAELNLDDLLHSIASRAVALLGGASGGLYLYRRDRDVLEWATSIGPKMVPIGTILRRGEGLSGKVWASGQHLIVDDYSSWEGRARVYEDYHFASTIGVPIQWGKEFLGVLNVLKDTTSGFTLDDAHLLELFATQAAVAIKNAQLFQAEHEQRVLAKALQEATAAVSSTLDLDRVFDYILDQMSRVVPSDASNIMLIEGDRVRIVRWRGYERFGGGSHLQSVAFYIADTPTLRQMQETCEPVIIPDTLTYDGWERVSDWVKSYAGAPIRVRDQVIGFLNVNAATPSFFNRTHTEHLGAFADQAGLAIENARLFRETSRRVEHLAALHQTGLAITSDLELAEVLNTLYTKLSQILDIGAFCVALYDEETGIIDFPLLTGSSGPHHVEPLDMHSRQGITGYVIQTRRPLYIPDTQRAVKNREPYNIIPLIDMPTRSYIGVPLISREKVIGVLSVQSYEPAAYTEAEVELVTTISSQAAIAIENARLFRNVEQGKRDWETTFDAMQDAVILVDHRGRISRVNRAFADLVHRPFLQIVGQSYSTVLQGATCSQPPCALEQSIESSQPAMCVHEYHGRMFEVQTTPIPNEQETSSKSPPYVIHVMRDITERKQAEEEIHRRNRELSLLNRIIATSASSQEMSAILETVCRELAQALGVPRAIAALFDLEMQRSLVVAEYGAGDGFTVLGQITPWQDNLAVQHILQHKTPLIVGNIQTDPNLEGICGPLQQQNAVSLLILPLKIEDQVVGALELSTSESRTFSAIEIGLAKRTADQISGALARARLEKTQRRLSTAVEQAAESIIITDTEGHILYVNPAFEQVTGWRRAQVIGKMPDILRSGRQDGAFHQQHRWAMAAGQVWKGRLVNKRADGTLYTVDSTITPVRSQTGEIVNYVATMRDVTREIELETQFQQAQKMEALGRLAGGIAHDFNNLLTVIQISVRLLERGLWQEDPLWEHVQRIRETSERTASLNKQLLSFSRHQVIELEVLDLNHLVSDLGRMLQRIIGEDIELETVLGDNLGRVRADPVQMDQVIMNLVVNARDAMPEGGKLTIETANEVLDESYIARHVDLKAGEYVRLTVRDTGMGMDSEVLSHLFEPFFTTKEPGRGTGLGLATVFGIVKQSNGHIEVQSKVGQGAAFDIFLPKVKAEVEVRVESEKTSGATSTPILAPTSASTILVVEDEPAVRELTVQILRMQDYRVLVAKDGAEALQVSRQYSGPIDLLLTDVVMPKMNGKELAERILAERPEMRVVYMSGYTNEAIGQHGVLEPGTTFVAKPLTMERLTETVQAVLDGRL
jgi:PAS domain S-box-containing protein